MSASQYPPPEPRSPVSEPLTNAAHEAMRLELHGRPIGDYEVALIRDWANARLGNDTKH